jgi:hypothetical protein
LEKDPFWSGVEFRLVSGKLAVALNIPQEAGLLIMNQVTITCTTFPIFKDLNAILNKFTLH